MPVRRLPARLLLGLLLLSAMTSGLACTGSCAQRPVYPVRGQVLLDNKPLADVLVLFHPEAEWGADESRPQARTDAEGRFEMSTYGAKDGAPAGEYKVSIVASTGDGEGATQADEGGPKPVRTAQPPLAYGQPQSSGLRASVKDGTNDLAPFKLKSNPRDAGKPAAVPVRD